MRARFGKYVAQSNEDSRRTKIIVKIDQQSWKQKVTIERHVAQTTLNIYVTHYCLANQLACTRLNGSNS